MVITPLQAAGTEQISMALFYGKHEHAMPLRRKVQIPGRGKWPELCFNLCCRILKTILAASDIGTSCFKNAGAFHLGWEWSPLLKVWLIAEESSVMGAECIRRLFTLGLGSDLAYDLRRCFGRNEEWPTPCTWAGSWLHRGRGRWCVSPTPAFPSWSKSLGAGWQNGSQRPTSSSSPILL